MPSAGFCSVPQLHVLSKTGVSGQKLVYNLLIMMPDHGPIYTESIRGLGGFPVEPWNTYSNVVFLICILYWGHKTRWSFRKHPFIMCVLPGLGIGLIGGTIYHATRANFIFLAMDFVPIIILGLATSIYFWNKVYRRMVPAISTVIVLLFLPRLFTAHLEPVFLRIGIGYGLLGLNIVLPIFLTVRQNRRESLVLLGAVISFIVALAFRQLDTGVNQPLFPMGSHFLWHIFGGLSVFFIIQITYWLDLSSELDVCRPEKS